MTDSSADSNETPTMPAARVDHVGIAVHDVDEAATTLQALGFDPVYRETSDDDTFEWATYVLGDASRIELIAPVTGESFLTEFLADHGPGLHHVTIEVADIDAAVDAVEAAGERVVGYAVERGWTEAFVSPSNSTGALFQLMEYHDAYDDRAPAEALYVRGDRLEQSAACDDRLD